MTFFLAAALVVTAIAAWTDWRTGEIPNWLSFGAILLAPVAHVVKGAAAGADRSTALMQGAYSVTGILVCVAVPLLMYQKGAIGGGDVKLFAALGAILRPTIGIEAEMYGFVAAALIAPARLAYDGKLLVTLRNSLFLVVNPFLPKEKKVTVQQELMTWFRMGPSVFIGMALTAMLHWRQP